MLKILIASALTSLTIGSVFADVSYSTFNYLEADGGSTFLTGIRADGSGNTDNVFITGVYTPVGASNTSGLIYQGSITNNTGTWNVVNFESTPGSTVTSTALYSPNGIDGGVRAVGSYKTAETGGKDIGLIYEGAVDGSGTWTKLDALTLDANTINTIAHSTHGSLVVGNYDTSLATGKAFVYNLDTEDWFDFTIDNVTSITAYGVWHNGGNSYTIAGGYSLDPTPDTLDQGYIADFNSETLEITNWRSYNFGNRPAEDAISHFDGITGDGNGGYNLTGDYVGVGAENGLGFFASVKRTEDGFSAASWTQISYPSSGGLDVDATSGNSVYENYVIGIYTANGAGVAQGYVAAVPEPTTGLLLVGMGGIAFLLRKRRAA